MASTFSATSNEPLLNLVQAFEEAMSVTGNAIMVTGHARIRRFEEDFQRNLQG